MDELDKYLAGIKVLAEQAISYKRSAVDFLENPPPQIKEAIEKLIAIRMSLLADSDYTSTKWLLDSGYFNAQQTESRVAAFRVVFELEDEISILRLAKSCEPYNENHPLFIAAPELMNKLHHSDGRASEMVDSSDFNWDATYQIVNLENTRARIHRKLRPELVSWLTSMLHPKYLYLRLDPYEVSRNLTPLLLETIYRPADPNWWKELQLHSGQFTSALYSLENSTNVNNQLEYWEYNVKGIKRLEVQYQRDNSGTLKGMIEELCHRNSDSYMVGFCLHFTSEDTVGTDWSNATASHIDGAINVYLKENVPLRNSSTLESGKIADASFRTHLFRVDNTDLRYLIPISQLFFNSVSLTKEWLFNQFQYKI